MSTTNGQQFDKLISFMEANEGIAKNFLNTPQFKETTNHLWNELKEELNSVGPPGRTVDGWKKVWKYNVKGKLRKNKLSVAGTGGGPNRGTKALSPLEDRVDRLLDLTTEINGLNIKKFGCPIGSNPNIQVDYVEIDTILVTTNDNFSIDRPLSLICPNSPFGQNKSDTPPASTSTSIQQNRINEVPSTSQNIPQPAQSGSYTNCHTPSRAATKKKETAKMLLKKQVQMQEEYYENFKKFNKRTEKNKIEQTKILKDIRKIKENNLKFQKEKWVTKQNLLLEKNKLKAEELELRKLELELKERKLDIN